MPRDAGRVASPSLDPAGPHRNARRRRAGRPVERVPSRQVERQRQPVEGVPARAVCAGVGQRGDHVEQQVAYLLDVVGEHPQHLVVGDALAVLEPGVEVGDERDRRCSRGRARGRAPPPVRRSCRRPTSPASACHSDSARVENRGPLTTTRVPPSTRAARGRDAAASGCARPSGSRGRRSATCTTGPTSS